MKSSKKIYNILLFLFFLTNAISAQTLSTSSKKATEFYSKARNSISEQDAITFAQKAIEEDKNFTLAFWFFVTLLCDIKNTSAI